MHRKCTSWEWYTQPNMFHLFFHLVLKANYKKTKWRGENVLRGQLLTGRKLLAIETGLTEQNIRTCLKNLVKTGEITIKTTKQYSVITVCNYDVYQSANEGSNQQGNQQVTSELTNSQPTGNQRVTTSNKVNKSKQVKQNNTKLALPSSFTEKEFKDLISHRKALKAPLTQLALDGIVKQVSLSGLSVSDCIQEMAVRSWKGFKADWVTDNKKKRKAGYVEATKGKDYTL